MKLYTIAQNITSLYGKYRPVLYIAIRTETKQIAIGSSYAEVLAKLLTK